MGLMAVARQLSAPLVHDGTGKIGIAEISVGFLPPFRQGGGKPTINRRP